MVTIFGTVVGALINGYFQHKTQRRTNSGTFNTATAGELIGRADRFEDRLMKMVDELKKENEKLSVAFVDLSNKYYETQLEKEILKIKALRLDAEIIDLKETVSELNIRLAEMCHVCPYMPEDKKVTT